MSGSVIVFSMIVLPLMMFATGNGAPSGSHYNLNLIGVPKGKTADLTDSNGHRIFVPLSGNCRINLSEGDFQVLDGNCTDGPAAFQLPNPDPENTGTSWYSVWARAVGTPGGTGNLNTCAMGPGPDDILGNADDEEVCSVAVLNLERTKGKQTFGDVSKYLLYIYADLDGDGTAERYNIFNDALYGYLWDYDNNGLKVVQLRFYPGVPSTVPAAW